MWGMVVQVEYMTMSRIDGAIAADLQRLGWFVEEAQMIVSKCCFFRVGQNHIYTVFIRYFWQGNHQIFGHIRCIHTVLANPMLFVSGASDIVWQQSGLQSGRSAP